ncbi:MAG: 23S rRNA (adenine(2503)-C(2))-methyltransferase RlmN [Balneolaceae bacterium]|nr:23S rRNA (adenine(2503)-C(2))-methyltransferase RlmN [Balneolaceae bacterium]
MADAATGTPRKVDIKSLSPEELEEFCAGLDLQSYRSAQIFRWLYEKGAGSFDEMTNLSKELRVRLSEEAELRRIEEVDRRESADGTVKFMFRLDDGEDHKVEAVMIPDFYPDGAPNRLTVCVSSQVGCVFGCSFCATGKMGLYRSLSHGEIVDQVQYINDWCLDKYDKKITNIVYMGMGEPLHNYRAVTQSASIITSDHGLELSPKRITVSTVGLPKQIKKLADERQPFNLAISLHAANDEKRNEIMPINQSMDLGQLRESLEHYYAMLHRPITYEYLLFDEFNDSPEDARELAQIVRWIPSKVNIIMYNKVAGVALKRAREERLDAFMQELVKHDVTATVRRSRGDDIDAGCGQLAIQEGKTKGKSIRKN